MMAERCLMDYQPRRRNRSERSSGVALRCYALYFLHIPHFEVEAKQISAIAGERTLGTPVLGR